MAAFNIPLEVKNPNIENPFQAAQQAMSIQGMQQERQLRQQQIQSNDISMQERALQAASKRALNQAIQSNLKTDPTTGAMSLDHNGLMNTLGTQGWGSTAIEYQGNLQKVLAEQAETRSKQIGSDQKALAGVSDILKGVNDDPSYQQAKPLIQAQIQKWGINIPLPDNYDAIKIGNLKQAGISVHDYLTAQKDANDLARWKATDLRTGVEAFDKAFRNELGATTSQPDLDRVLKKYGAIAGSAPEEYRGGYTAILNSAPNRWTAEVARQMAEEAIPAQEREKFYQQQVVDTGNLLASKGGTLAGYTRTYDSITNPKVQSLFRNPEELKSAADLRAATDEAMSVATTPAQKIQQKEAEARIAESKAFHEGSLEVRRTAVDVAQQRADTSEERAGTYKERVEEQFNKKESDKAGGIARAAEQQRAIADVYHKLINTRDGDTFADPKTGKEQTMNQGTRQAIYQQFVKLGKNADALDKQAREIRARIQGSAAALPNPEAAPAPAPPVAPKQQVHPPSPPSGKPPAAAKVFPRARLAEFAAAQKPPMTADQAEAALKANGYVFDK